MNSKIGFVIAVVLLTVFTVFYYPKWNKHASEATLSWDVSGYYMYLPALFIYDDITQLEFLPGIIEEYQPTSHNQQAFRYHNGNFVMKYSSGQAVMYLPFFGLAHLYASLDSTYPADGFSYPYQVAIGLGSLLIAFLGLWFLRKILLLYFSEAITAWTLIILVGTTNYLEYAGITGAMTHNWLFTLYTLLIWLTIHFYKNPSLLRATGIGALIGLAALTRPTEIISCLIPILWGITHPRELKDRVGFFFSNIPYLASAVISCILIGSVQLIYWKLVAGDIIVYSYEEEGFSWLSPHITNGLFSYKAGWLMYSPSMIFALIGIPFLIRKKIGLFWTVLVYVLIHLYITLAWDIWWYGGSLGQRSMIQTYPMLAFAMAAFFEWVSDKKVWKYVVAFLCTVFAYYNIWLVIQAHDGGLLHVSQMTRSYFWEVVGRYGDFPLETQKYLDTNEKFRGSERQEVIPILMEDFDAFPPDSTIINPEDSTDRWLLMNAELQHSPKVVVERSQIPPSATWMRVNANYYAPQKEWNMWAMTQLIITFVDGDQVRKSKKIRLHRMLYDKSWKAIFMDTRVPQEPFTHVEIYYWNAQSQLALYVDDMEVEAFH